MTTTTTAQKSVPMYVQFAAALRARAEELGLQFESAATETGFPQNDGYFFVRTGPSAAAMIVPKGKGRMANVHLHIPLDPTTEGYVALPKKNGRVLCHFAADLDLIAKHVLPALPGASKRPVARPLGTTHSKPVEAPVGDVFGAALDDLLAVSEPASGSFASVEESEEEFQTVG